MSAEIGPGDWVECVSSGLLPGDERLEQGDLVLGQIYQVHCCEVVLGLDCIQLCEFQEIESDGFVPAFQLAHFSPIYRPRKGAFDHLKEPVQRLTEDA